MSEVLSRPSAATRGRGSGRGGRGGGFSTRGGSRTVSRTTPTNGESKHEADSAMPTLEDEGEIGQLNKQYGGKVSLIKEMFPDWSDVDILFALRETDGDENLAVTRMADGTVQQWGEVSKPKKERAKPKGKNDTFTTTTADLAPGAPRTTRGGRVGAEGGRGRGRATERGGRGGSRGKSTAPTTNGTRSTTEPAPLSVPTEESSEWDTPKATEETPAWGETTSNWETPAPVAEAAPVAATPVAAPVAAPKASAVPNGAKTWASMLRQVTAPKVVAKPKEAPIPKPAEAEPIVEPLPAAEPVEVEAESPVAIEEPVPEPVKTPIPTPPVELPAAVVPEIALPPSRDQLTETNLEQVIDESHPPETETAASEAADSWDPRGPALSNTATPSSASQQQHQPPRAPPSGFAATATKATAERAATRTPSYTRRVLDQQEPVRMPGNRDQVERAAVQFGAFNLTGNVDDDIDGDREEPETRPQPPEDSPVAHPRTSLPPVQPAPVPEAYPTQKPAASLPPTGPSGMGYFPSSFGRALLTNSPPAAAPPAQIAPAPTSQSSFFPDSPDSNFTLLTLTHLTALPQSLARDPRFGQPAPQEPSSYPSSKPFETYPQQQASAAAAQSQFEAGFSSQAQSAQPQGQQQPGGAYSSAPAEYSSYYTADAQGQNAYNYYNQQFGQQQQQQRQAQQQEGLPSQPPRSFGAYTAPQSDNLSQYPQSGAHVAGRGFGAASGADAQISGTPTPAQSTVQGQTAQTAAQGQSHGQQQPHDYPYSNHPYYNNPYYSAYMNYQGGYNQQAYGAPYGKGGLGYQPNQYGMSPQGPHGYASSPAGGFGQSTLHRDTGVSAGLAEYRAASGQSGQQQQALAGSGFGGMHDTFGRGASAYQQAGQSFNAPGSQPGAGPSAVDDLKPFGDAKVAGGPSPSLGAAARPGSAANNGPSQSGLPPPQSNQGGAYGGYPSQLQGHGLHGSQTGAAGYGVSASGAQGHQNNYGAYGGQSFGGSYYGNQPPQPRGGWGTNYGH
ncbi:hypothetical protein B0H63DRAFT_389469 [Podospora didyma]|uniref:RNA polymerase II degradation factor 1 n=1 Tax=Podospora didyma TaxID=330526 RepID=A0AAE0U4X9_9PEZI|nr:hypothetical protein B0H63DRAFT_389469 [Podospora didyma]